MCDNDTDVIGLVEITPKNTTYMIQQPVEMEIPGYCMYYSLVGRGAALYVKNGFRVMKVVQEGSEIPAVWCEIVLTNWFWWE